MRKDDVNLRNEHETIRKRVGFHDFTHQLFEVRGPDADSFLDKMFVKNIAGSKIGQGKYTTMLNERGHLYYLSIIFIARVQRIVI